ncbi:MAG: protein-glutamate O-methyltransferase CheR [Pirellulaceae bacterium]|jgi:chemotaxis protein methyltransferase CheR|nr:protein-glutamate O-methyltransferase CheR [Pirellulaceae bacterium]
MTTLAATPALDSLSFEYVRKLVLERSAIALETGKGYLVESRLMPIARAHGHGTLSAFIESLRRQPHGILHTQVVEAMTTNETSFFRDIHPFDALRTIVLPELVSARSAAKKLNLWSAACSTGQEPYSIAILLAEHFPALSDWTVNIYATDLSQQVLDRAQAGQFTQLEANRGLPAALLVKYFDKVGLHWHIKPAIKRRVRFLQANLIEPWPMLPAMDVIFMRNVLIYFTPETKRQILSKVRGQLAAGGTLFLGGAETTLGIDDAWRRVNHGKTSTYRLGPAANS